MHSAFNLFVFPNSMFTTLLLFFLFLYERAMSSPEKLHLKNNHYYYSVRVVTVRTCIKRQGSVRPIICESTCIV